MQQTLDLRQVAQPSVLSVVTAAAVKSVKSVQQLVERTEERVSLRIEQSEFCRVLGVEPWQFSLKGVAVTALVFFTLLIICGVAEWLEGGAA